MRCFLSRGRSQNGRIRLYVRAHQDTETVPTMSLANRVASFRAFAAVKRRSEAYIVLPVVAHDSELKRKSHEGHRSTEVDKGTERWSSCKRERRIRDGVPYTIILRCTVIFSSFPAGRRLLRKTRAPDIGRTTVHLRPKSSYPCLGIEEAPTIAPTSCKKKESSCDHSSSLENKDFVRVFVELLTQEDLDPTVLRGGGGLGKASCFGGATLRGSS
ncbi:hypothetical protein PUN28_003937 [Cardiocondyla obscurior]|uniref:Uncharacterized protein n=1 Tax=Cardiocondyla obscurior TaxID=286306 RepID=A0AAW2GP20_9HYME